MNLEQLGAMVGGFAVNFATPSSIGASKPASAAIESFLAALEKATGALERIGGMLSSFVEKVSPATVEIFTQRVRDFKAVIGTAFRPILETITNLLKSLSDRLYPLVQKLLPVIERVAGEVAQTLIRSFEDMAFSLGRSGGLFKVLIEFIGSLVKVTSDLMRVFLALQRFLIYAIVGAPDLNKKQDGKDIGDLAKDLFKKLHDAIMAAVKAVVLFAAKLMQAFGWERGLKALTTAFESMRGGKGEVKDTAGIAVAYNARWTTGLDLGREVMLQAYRASAAGGPVKRPEEETNDWLKQIHEELVNLKLDENDWVKKMADSVNDAIKKVVDWISSVLDEIKKSVMGLVDMVRKMVSDALDGFMTWLGGKNLFGGAEIDGVDVDGVLAQGEAKLDEADTLIDRLTGWFDERGRVFADHVLDKTSEWYDKNVAQTMENIRYSAEVVANYIRWVEQTRQKLGAAAKSLIGVGMLF